MIQKDLFTEAEITTVSPAIAKPFVSRSTFYQGDCLVEMDKIADKSIDMILCDLPYGTTACKWDSIIPFEPLWKHYERVIKDNGAIVLFGKEPFSSFLRISNIKIYKYDLIWQKDRLTNIFTVKYRFGDVHENMSVFYKNQCTYNPQKVKGWISNNRPNCAKTTKMAGGNYNETMGQQLTQNNMYEPLVNPISILKFNREFSHKKPRMHPTQKPVELMEYLIKTYTNEGETVLDNCMGSGTTGVACKKTGRHFIGIEKDEKYFEIAVSRVSAYCG